MSPGPDARRAQRPDEATRPRVERGEDVFTGEAHSLEALAEEPLRTHPPAVQIQLAGYVTRQALGVKIAHDFLSRSPTTKVAARRAGTRPERLVAWARGEKAPSWRTIERLRQRTEGASDWRRRGGVAELRDLVAVCGSAEGAALSIEAEPEELQVWCRSGAPGRFVGRVRAVLSTLRAVGVSVEGGAGAA